MFGFFAKRKAEKQRLLEWQNAIIENPQPTLVIPEEQLKKITLDRINNAARIISDIVDLVTNTVNPDVFFSRYDEMLRWLEDLCMLAKHMSFSMAGKSPRRCVQDRIF